MSKPKKIILIGAGDRGITYASYALKHPDKLRIVGVAEPIKERREKIANKHKIASGNIFNSWEKLLKKPPIADGAIITTQDTMHVGPAVTALENGYHVLLEKPMALTREECDKLLSASRDTGLTLNICHVLRYTHFFSTIKSILSKGIIGNIYTIYHGENVSYYHMAHSYVRGNWGKSHDASPMILAKCCHDMDLIAWFTDSRPKYISSFGRLSHFNEKNAPVGAPLRCTDGCPASTRCKYFSVDTYLYGKHVKMGIIKTEARLLSIAAKLMLRLPSVLKYIPGLTAYSPWSLWPTSTITQDLSKEGIMTALRKGPYGRCVYHCDNDQVDHQETIIEFENGATAVLKMHGHSEQEGRTLRIDGSKGTLRGRFGGGGHLEVHIHETGEKIIYPVKTDLIGHSEGDDGIMENFVNVLNGGKGHTTADDSILSHEMAFAAHEARVKRKIIDFQF